MVERAGYTNLASLSVLPIPAATEIASSAELHAPSAMLAVPLPSVRPKASFQERAAVGVTMIAQLLSEFLQQQLGVATLPLPEFFPLLV